ncbi:hypothetical protein C7C46_27775 [Streptomyces tateyamensis]|uniref:Uncharacterized protein n=1 Tax=Streptomyces tateyamensis TaxID=565073 RepID=A0A2V4NIT5_9ACTN|nr:hypothetical protein [Streptomyces tateyamensis]PYC69768.1 hypothetical protein C7C46_27775 [Streptomyces tateyamensis]
MNTDRKAHRAVRPSALPTLLHPCPHCRRPADPALRLPGAASDRPKLSKLLRAAHPSRVGADPRRPGTGRTQRGLPWWRAYRGPLPQCRPLLMRR